VARPPERVLLDGIRRTDWHWDQGRQAVTLQLSDDGASHQLSVELSPQ
jgi:hypothetical protein